MPIILKLLQKIKEKGMLANLFYMARITLTPMLDKDTATKDNHRLIPLTYIDVKNFNRIRVNQIQQPTGKIIHHKQVGFISGMEGCFSICKSKWKIKVIWLTQQIQKKHLKKHQHFFHDKNLHQIRLEGMYFNIIKAII